MAIGRTNATRQKQKDYGFPEFTYSGTHEKIDDGIVNGRQQFRYKFKTSGILNFSKLGNAADGIDVFALGAGGAGSKYRGGGGGSGYTTTARGIKIEAGVDYPITIGAGGTLVHTVTNGARANSGGATSAFGVSAAGGQGGAFIGSGGNGGSGGGGHSHAGKAGNGGSNGGNGGKGADGYAGGTGQGTTTREFGEENGTLYGGGGGGGSYGSTVGNGGTGGGGKGAASWGSKSTAGGTNTGGGGGGGGGGDLASQGSTYIGSVGGSGIVVIRNAR